VTASFAAVPVQLSVSKAGTGSGTVSSPAGIACGATCQTGVTYNAAVALTAVAAPGSTFTGWSEAACAGSATCTVTLDADRAVTATFTIDPPAPPVADAGGAEAPAPQPVVVAPVAVAPVTTAPVAPRPALKVAPKLRTRPKLTGRARIGRTLTCTRGTWTGSPTRFTFTWFRGQGVVGHGSAHLVRAADRGQTLRCSVTARNPGGATVAATTALRVAR
jgi:hypothetical protein